MNQCRCVLWLSLLSRKIKKSICFSKLWLSGFAFTTILRATLGYVGVLVRFQVVPAYCTECSLKQAVFFKKKFFSQLNARDYAMWGHRCWLRQNSKCGRVGTMVVSNLCNLYLPQKPAWIQFFIPPLLFGDGKLLCTSDFIGWVTQHLPGDGLLRSSRNLITYWRI